MLAIACDAPLFLSLSPMIILQRRRAII